MIDVLSHINIDVRLSVPLLQGSDTRIGMTPIHHPGELAMAHRKLHGARFGSKSRVTQVAMSYTSVMHCAMSVAPPDQPTGTHSVESAIGTLLIDTFERLRFEPELSSRVQQLRKRAEELRHGREPTEIEAANAVDTALDVMRATLCATRDPNAISWQGRVTQVLDAVAAFSSRPPPAAVLVLETGWGGGDIGALFLQHAHAFEEYEARYAWLLQQRCPWINMIYIGAYREFSVLLLEVGAPNQHLQVDLGRTEVLVSGASDWQQMTERFSKEVEESLAAAIERQKAESAATPTV